MHRILPKDMQELLSDFVEKHPAARAAAVGTEAHNGVPPAVADPNTQSLFDQGVAMSPSKTQRPAIAASVGHLPGTPVHLRRQNVRHLDEASPAPEMRLSTQQKSLWDRLQEHGLQG